MLKMKNWRTLWNYKKVSQNINNIVNDQVRKLESIFPSAVKDGEVDFEALKRGTGTV